MQEQDLARLSRRERQIMDVVFSQGRATAADVRKSIHAPPSYSTVRTQLRVLEEKGFLRHRQQGNRYVYYPTITPARARVSALRHVLRTFFYGSAEGIVAALMDISAAELTEADYGRLARIIERARRDGRQL